MFSTSGWRLNGYGLVVLGAKRPDTVRGISWGWYRAKCSKNYRNAKSWGSSRCREIFDNKSDRRVFDCFWSFIRKKNSTSSSYVSTELSCFPPETIRTRPERERRVYAWEILQCNALWWFRSGNGPTSSIGSFTNILQLLSVVMRLIVNRTFIAGFYSLT